MAAAGRRTADTAGTAGGTAAAAPGRTRAAAASKPRTTAAQRKKRTPPDPAAAWARTLARTRPGLVPFVLDALTTAYGVPTWQRVHDPTSELVLTILSQNSADINAERAFDALRAAYPRETGAGPDPAAEKVNRPGWGGVGIGAAAPPDWTRVEEAPLPELVAAIRPGGLAQQKAPRIQAALRTIRAARGDHSLEFLGALPPLEARAWLTAIDGIGKKTASVVLLFAFGMPLMPVDRHVERVSHRIGLIPPKADADAAHDIYLAMIEPERAHMAHVNLITHGRKTCHAIDPACSRCPIAPRCRHIDRRAP
jgi:endonuclease-3